MFSNHRFGAVSFVSYLYLDVYKRQVKDVVVKTADEIISSVRSDMKYKVGTMIEIPRAALTADEIEIGRAHV